jgi:hypothetical protein
VSTRVEASSLSTPAVPRAVSEDWAMSTKILI